jgi:hypothetical protein
MAAACRRLLHHRTHRPGRAPSSNGCRDVRSASAVTSTIRHCAGPAHPFSSVTNDANHHVRARLDRTVFSVLHQPVRILRSLLTASLVAGCTLGSGNSCCTPTPCPPGTSNQVTSYATAPWLTASFDIPSDDTFSCAVLASSAVVYNALANVDQKANSLFDFKGYKLRIVTPCGGERPDGFASFWVVPTSPVYNQVLDFAFAMPDSSPVAQVSYLLDGAGVLCFTNRPQGFGLGHPVHVTVEVYLPIGSCVAAAPGVLPTSGGVLTPVCCGTTVTDALTCLSRLCCYSGEYGQPATCCDAGQTCCGSACCGLGSTCCNGSCAAACCNGKECDGQCCSDGTCGSVLRGGSCCKAAGSICGPGIEPCCGNQACPGETHLCTPIRG